MKTLKIILIGTSFALSLLACLFSLWAAARSEPTFKRTQMETKISALESELLALKMEAAQLNHDSTNQYAINADVFAALSASKEFMSNVQFATAQCIFTGVSNDARLDTIEAALRIRRAPVSYQTYPRLTNGIPVEVYNKILAAALREHPTDYLMQFHKVKSEIEDYKKLHP